MMKNNRHATIDGIVVGLEFKLKLLGNGISHRLRCVTSSSKHPKTPQPQILLEMALNRNWRGSVRVVTIGSEQVSSSGLNGYYDHGELPALVATTK